MKKILSVIASMFFIVSCASTSVSETKVAQKEEVKQESSEGKSGKACGPKRTGSRLKRNC